jgi:hypothetical protein
MKAFTTTKLIIFSMLLGFSCSKTDVVTPTTTTAVIKAGKYLGVPVVLNNAKLQSFVNFSADNVPSAVGLKIPKVSIDYNFDFFALRAFLPTESGVLGSFVRCDLSKINDISGLQDATSTLIEFTLYNEISVLQQVKPADLKALDKSILPTGFKTFKTFADNTEYFVNGDKSLMVRTYNNKIIEYVVVVDSNKLRNNPNYSFAVPLPTQKGFFPTKVSVIQTGTDIEVVLDGLTEVK